MYLILEHGYGMLEYWQLGEGMADMWPCWEVDENFSQT